MNFSQPERLQALPPYLFVEIDRKKRELASAGKDVIDFGVGDPDLPTPAFIRERMKSALDDASNHRYPLGVGKPAFRQAIARFFERRYNVGLDWQSQVLALIGTKEGLGHLPLACINPGQTVLIPDPGYPVYHSGTLFAGGVPHALPLSETTDWLPDLGSIPSAVARDAAMLFLNYPNNPTGAVAPREFLEDAVAFCRENDIVLVQDAAYNEMFYAEDDRAESVLAIDGARDVAVELHSASKTFNMTGWRLGVAVGRPDVLTALAKLKNNIDSGVFGAVQDAGIAAYEGIDRPELDELRSTYVQRAEALVPALRNLGFSVQMPRATFYVWAGVPEGYDSMTTAAKILDEAHVVRIPGVGFGACGEGYVRFALTVPEERIRIAVGRMRRLDWAP